MKVENLFNAENIFTLLQFFFPHRSLRQLLFTYLKQCEKESVYRHALE